MLVYTWADEKYYPFAVLYPLFVLLSNPEALVEIAVADYGAFYEKYKHLLNYYDDKYAGRVLFHQSDNLFEAQPGTMRFVTQPLWKAKYVYIGDVDIFVCHDILEPIMREIICGRDIVPKPKSLCKTSVLLTLSCERLCSLSTLSAGIINRITDKSIDLPGICYKLHT